MIAPVAGWPSLTAITAVQVLSFPCEGTATFTWDAREPIAVNMEVDLPFLETVTVQFARELLDQALVVPGRPAGIGDVIVEELQPGNPMVPHSGLARELNEQGESSLRFLLARDGGSHVGLLVPREPVSDFMVRSFLHVPASREYSGVDEAIENILGAA